MPLPLRAAALVVAASALLASPASAQGPAPSLRLLAADRSVRVSADELEFSLDVGLWVAATGGEFRIRVRRPGYGRWEAVQVEPGTGAPLRTVPARLLSGASGFRRFLDVRFRRGGRLAAHRTLSFCPSLSERVADDGPQQPTFLGFCDTTFPFAVGSVWGIDRGWASSVANQFGGDIIRPLKLRPGRYRVTARIRGPFRRVFAIPAAQAQAQVALRVTRGFEEGPHPVFENAHATRSRVRALAAQATQSPDPDSLPDLIALPPWQLATRHQRDRDWLVFAGSPWNAGPGPLLVEGYRRPGRDVMAGMQYFVNADGDVTGNAPAGTFRFHAGGGHNHWHFLQFVSYTIRRRSGERVVGSRKQSFCLASTDAVDLTVPGARLIPDLIGLGGSACGDNRSIWLRETLPAGWGDTYTPDVSGQRFDITNVPNGRYRVQMYVNPFGELHEASTANNVASRRITLRGKPGKRHVRVGAWHGIRD
jgi:hypothetical protein